MLGDSPDVMDVSMTFTPAIRYVQSRNTFTPSHGNGPANFGLYREALHEVYIPRIRRGDASFAANILGARSALLSVLVHFFERGRWGSLAQTTVAGERASARSNTASACTEPFLHRDHFAFAT